MCPNAAASAPEELALQTMSLSDQQFAQKTGKTSLEAEKTKTHIVIYCNDVKCIKMKNVRSFVLIWDIGLDSD